MVLVWTVWVKVIGNVALKGVERPEVFGSGPVELIQDFTDSSLCSAHLLSLLLDKSLWISSFDHRGDFNMWMAWWNRHRLSIRSRNKKPKLKTRFFFWRKWKCMSVQSQCWSLCDTLVSRYGLGPSVYWFLLKHIIIWSCLNTVLGTFKLSVVFVAGLDGLITFLTPNSRVIPRHPWFPQACYVTQPWFISW